MNLIELALLTWIVTIGLLFAAPLWPYDRVGLALISPVSGAALYVLSGVALFAVDSFSTIGSLGLASIVAIVVFGMGFTRGHVHIGPDLLMSAGFLMLGTLAVLAIATLGAFGRLTPDSMDYLTTAGGLERFGSIPPFTPQQILKRQFTTPVLQTLGVVTGRGYFLSIITLIVTSGFSLMLWFGWKGLKLHTVASSRVIVVVGLIGGFIFSTNRVLYSFFYVNGHGVFAALLLTFVGVVWYAAETDKWSAAVLAGLAGAMIVPLRAEAIIVLAFFMLPALVSRDIPQRARWALVLPMSATAIVWHGLVLPRLLPEGSLGPTSTPVVAVVIAVALVALVAALQVDALARFAKWIPLAGFLVVVAYTAVASLDESISLYQTLNAMGSNLAFAGLWGVFWWITPLVIAVCITATKVSHQSRFLWGLAAYPVLLLTFSFLRGSGYRVGPGDSANRMLMHVVFVIGLYLILAVGQLVAQLDDEEWSIRGLYRVAADSLTVK